VSIECAIFFARPAHVIEAAEILDLDHLSAEIRE